MHGGHGQFPHESPPGCSAIEHQLSGYRRTPNFTWSELNDGFSQGNPHGGNGGGWAWVQPRLTMALERLRANWGQELLSTIYGKGIPLSSGYRCPHGNASIAGASFRSWHMTGRAADVNVKSMADVVNDWSGMTDEEKVKEIWDTLTYLTPSYS